jgi:hypothetical protein
MEYKNPTKRTKTLFVHFTATRTWPNNTCISFPNQVTHNSESCQSSPQSSLVVDYTVPWAKQPQPKLDGQTRPSGSNACGEANVSSATLIIPKSRKVCFFSSTRVPRGL